MNEKNKKWLFNIGCFMMVFGVVLGIGCAFISLFTLHQLCIDILMCSFTIAIIGMGISIGTAQDDTEPYQYGCKDCDYNTNDFIEAHHHAVNNNHKTFHRMFQK